MPEELISDIQFGVRVEVPLKNKLYSALVIDLQKEMQMDYKPRTIVSIIDKEPIIGDQQFKLWNWISNYYSCTIGEVMNVALPSGLKLTSETKVYINPNYQEDMTTLSDEEYMIAEAITIQNELTIGEIRSILDKKTVYPVIRSLLDKEVVYVREELIEKYKPKNIGVVQLAEAYKKEPNKLSEVLDAVKKSEKQTRAILAIYQFSKSQEFIPKSDIYEISKVDNSVLRALEKKGIIELSEMEVSRLVHGNYQQKELPLLTDDQSTALKSISAIYKEKSQILLHGVTGSGKTRIYIELIREQLALGKQVLYLLPEIALTTQIVSRLRAVFGDDVGTYHSRMGNAERVEIWKAVNDEKPIVLGARSSMFLPYKNLGLIIVDEEHDSSYKQQDPAPRYNGRDTAVVMAQLHDAKVILGSATPSLESFHNVNQGKYGLVQLKNRIGSVALPEIEVVDLRYEYKTKRIKNGFSLALREGIEKALANDEQAMIFQNRRGYAPTIQCDQCGWHAECNNCDVSLTVHKFFNELRCHYCGSRRKMIETCPACGSHTLNQKGYGTEKIEAQIRELFPDAKVARMDYDTTKTKNAYQNIIADFTAKKIDILVGTQMITKGLDFEDIGIVGILNADLSLQFPDFRAGERAYQLFTQVAGRAGRKRKQGKVIIQSFQPTHPVILETIDNNYDRFFAREMAERQKFVYPPFYRFIQITLKHKQPKTVLEAAHFLAKQLSAKFGNRILGPTQPGVARLRGQYLQNITIKMEKDPKVMNGLKRFLMHARLHTLNSPGFKSVRINLDVDPY